jgi:hypothetical protein
VACFANQGELIVSKGMPDWYEQTLRGNAFVYAQAAAGAALGSWPAAEARPCRLADKYCHSYTPPHH